MQSSSKNYLNKFKQPTPSLFAAEKPQPDHHAFRLIPEPKITASFYSPNNQPHRDFGGPFAHVPNQHINQQKTPST